MQEKISLQNCGEDEVLSRKGQMWKLGSLKDGLRNLFSDYKLGEEICKTFNINLGTKWVKGNGRHNNIPISNQEWFRDGIECEVLKIGSKGWQKGKVKINLQVCLEFCPDEPEVEETPVRHEPESPLDDIRRMINQNN